MGAVDEAVNGDGHGVAAEVKIFPQALNGSLAITRSEWFSQRAPISSKRTLVSACSQVTLSSARR